METIIESIEIKAEIRDPVAIKFYSTMPGDLRKAYAEILLTGAAYLAAQKDIANDSLRLIENTAKKVQDDANNGISKFVKDEVPGIFQDTLKETLEKWWKTYKETLPSAKDYPDLRQMQNILEQTLRLFKTIAESKGQQDIIQQTPVKGRCLEDEIHQALIDKYGGLDIDIEDVRNIAGSKPQCKLGDFVLKGSRFKICVETTQEHLSLKHATEKIDKAMMNRSCEGAVLIFGNYDQIPGKVIEKIGMNKFLAYFGSGDDGTWDIAINMSIALIESQKASELSNNNDIIPEVAKLANKLPEMIVDLDNDLKNEQARAQRIESTARGFRDSMVDIRANKLTAIRQVSDLLLTLLKPETKDY